MKYFGGGGGGGGGAVSSVFGRSGAVVAATGDYNSTQITNSSSVAGTGVTGALNTLGAAIAGLVTGVSSVFGRAGAVVAAAGDYTSTLITNASAVAGATVTAALNTLNGSLAALAITAGQLAIGTGTTVTNFPGIATGDVPAWNGSAWVSTTLTPIFTIPSNPGDNGKVPIVSAGNFTYLAGASAGQALIWSGSAWGASADFATQNVTTSGTLVVNSASAGFLRLGLVAGSGAGSASSIGLIQMREGGSIYARNSADTLNARMFDWNTGTMAIGQSSVVDNLSLFCSGVGNFTVTVSTLAITATTGSVSFGRDTITTTSTIANSIWGPAIRSSGTSVDVRFSGQKHSGSGGVGGIGFFTGGDATNAGGGGTRRGGKGILKGGDVTIAGGTAIGGHAQVAYGIAAGGSTGIACFATIAFDPDTVAWVMQGGIYVRDAATAPTGGSGGAANGFQFYSGGGVPKFMTAASNMLSLDAINAATATTGASGTLPVQVAGYLTLQYHPSAGSLTTIKVPYYLN